MATKTITRIDPIQYGKIMAVILAIIYGVSGLLMTIFMGIFGAMIATIPGANAAVFGGLGIVFGIAMTIAMVIGGAIGGFIMGVIGAFIYNFVAEKIGGIKIDLE